MPIIVEMHNRNDYNHLDSIASAAKTVENSALQMIAPSAG
jgi:hypothetical protein